MVTGWSERQLGEMGVFSKGSGISKADADSGNIPAVRYGEIYTVHNDYIKGFFSRISAEVACKAKQLRYGDLLFTGSGETRDEIGKCVAFLDNITAYAGSDIIILSPYNSYDSMFLGYLLNSPAVVSQKAQKGQGDAVVHITSSALFDIILTLPESLLEQRAIAAALSDADSYIAALERLIAKKRNIKQGAMQELLTGKRRLPGFTGEWNIKLLGEVLKVGHGKSQRGIETASGKYPILATSGVIGRTSVFLYDKPSVLIGRKGTIDKPQYMDSPFWTIDTLYYTIINEESYPRYLYYLFCTIDWSSLNEASGVPSLSANVIEKLQVIIPEKPEQTAIATFLSDMDAEIDALAAQLDKAKYIKQGMMQELLTGRIRLLSTEQDVAQPSNLVEMPTAAGTAKRNDGYEDAVILVALVNAFGTEQHPFTAFDSQKFPYLFHRHMEGVAKGFGKFAAGPYNSDYKYKTAQPIALKKNYIREHTSSYRGYITDANAQEALTYFAKWYGDEPLKWLAQFRYIPKRKDELELLTTTDKAMVELRGKGVAVCLQSVKELIKKTPAWKNKLTRPIFSDDNIKRAIGWSNELFGEEVPANV